MKIKCEKCGLAFKDRQDPEDAGAYKTLCWNCRFVWTVIGMVLHGLPEKINRDVMIRLEDVHIQKKIKR